MSTSAARDKLRRAERDEMPRRVQHLRRRRVGGVQVPDGVSEDGGDVLVTGQSGHPRGAGRAAVLKGVDDLDDRLAVSVPAAQRVPRGSWAARRDRLADVTVRAEEDDEAGGDLGDHFGRDGRCVTVGMGRRHEAAERGPALTARGEQRHPERAGDVVRTGNSQRQIRAEQRFYPDTGTRLGMFERPVQPVPVGQREGRHPEVRRARDQGRRGRRAVSQRIRRRDMQVSEQRHGQSATLRSVQASSAMSRRNS
jgi:hypothetical protein